MPSLYVKQGSIETTAVCPVCGEAFTYQRARNYRKYCSPGHAAIAHRASVTRYRTADPDRTRTNSRQAKLRQAYGIGVVEYAAMLEAQGGGCAVCGKPDEPSAGSSHGRLHVDHDHACCPGKNSCGACIRGLLCNGCNLAAGHALDSPKRLRAIADYLEQ